MSCMGFSSSKGSCSVSYDTPVRKSKISAAGLTATYIIEQKMNLAKDIKKLKDDLLERRRTLQEHLKETEEELKKVESLEREFNS